MSSFTIRADCQLTGDRPQSTGLSMRTPFDVRPLFTQSRCPEIDSQGERKQEYDPVAHVEPARRPSMSLWMRRGSEEKECKQVLRGSPFASSPV